MRMISETVGQLRRIIEALASDLYHPLGEIILEGFSAPSALTLREAEKHPRTPLPAGTAWGMP